MLTLLFLRSVMFPCFFFNKTLLEICLKLLMKSFWYFPLTNCNFLRYKNLRIFYYSIMILITFKCFNTILIICYCSIINISESRNASFVLWNFNFLLLFSELPTMILRYKVWLARNHMFSLMKFGMKYSRSLFEVFKKLQKTNSVNLSQISLISMWLLVQTSRILVFQNATERMLLWAVWLCLFKTFSCI